MCIKKLLIILLIMIFDGVQKLFTNLLLLGIIVSVSLQGFVFFYKYNSISNPKDYNEKYINSNLKLNYLNKRY